MKIITSITWEHIRKNRRSSLAVMMAVLLSSTLLCSFCIFGFAYWNSSVENAIRTQGNWHGELHDSISGENLQYVEGNPNVEAVILKGEWQALRLPEGSAASFLFLRDANAAYWRDMPEKDSLVAGRLPQQADEIAVSKLFFDRNPDYTLGDTLALPVGERILDGEAISIQSIQREGEGFRQTGERNVTLVGELDLTTSTAYPGYYSLGYLDREAVRPDDQVTLYLRFKNIRDTYKLLPEIARTTEAPTNDFGEYRLVYNTSLLSYYGVTDGSAVSLRSMANGLMMACVVVLLMATFALIINSVFSLSAGARIRQMGMLRSIGADPGQIRASILLEGLLLSVIPLFISVLLGYFFSLMMGSILTSISGDLLDYDLTIKFSPIVATAGMGVSLATVLLAVSSTSRKLAKLTPIEAVKGTAPGKKMKKAKEKNHPVVKRLFGYPGVLAMNNLAAYRKTFRMPVAALCLSFVLVSGSLSMIGLTRAYGEAEAVEQHYDVTATLFLSQQRDESLTEQMCSQSGVTESVVFSKIDVGMEVSAADEAAEFTQIGGFAGLEKNNNYLREDKGGWQIQGTLLGLDHASFAQYCDNLGIDPTEYFADGQPKVVAVNRINPYPKARNSETREQIIPYLDLTEGREYTLTERTLADNSGNHTFNVSVGAITDSYPAIDEAFPNYKPIFVVPLEQYDAIVGDFLPERANLYRPATVKLVTDLDDSRAEAQLEQLCGSYLGTEDYEIETRDGVLARQAASSQATLAMNGGIAALFALIGIFNAFSAVTGNLIMRRKEFAMLRSVGLDDKGFSHVLFLEGLFFSLRPILLALPWVALINAFFVWLLDMPLAMFATAFPWAPILIYAVIIIGAMGLAYVYGAKKIRREAIVVALRSGLI